jgi:hypothetical protein
MHGGALGSGAPSGKRNGRYRHGWQTKEAIASRAEIAAWARVMRTAAKAILSND